MRIHLISFFLLITSLNLLAQDNSTPSVSTMIPADSRYEIIQSNVAARLTLKIDKFTGDTYQLAEDKKQNVTFWIKLERIAHPEDDLSLINVQKVNYQFFSSGLGVRFTFLININTGATWQLVINKNEDYLWEPMF